MERKLSADVVFLVTALDRPPTDPLDISVRLDSGSDTAAECRFIMPAPAVPNARIDVAAAVSLPLGGALLRQRRETLKGSIEVTDTPGGGATFTVSFPLAVDRAYAGPYLDLATQPLPRTPQASED
jgi:hypothetical protein